MDADNTPRTGDIAGEFRVYAERMQQLAEIFMDPARVERLYFGPAPHQEAEEGAIILDSADYLPFLAVESLKAKLENLRRTRRGGGL